MAADTIELVVNEQSYPVEVGPKTSLLQVLRDQLHLRATVAPAP
jgi:aerobic-type carbon monoxide dehydrogenase small subunit (CoxS/CutS family)